MGNLKGISGFQTLLKALKDTPKQVLPYLRKAMTLSVRRLQAYIDQYPPATDANQPGRVGEDGRPLGYYERGRGWWYPVMQKKTLGPKTGVSTGAETAKRAAARNKVKSIPTVAGYKLAGGGESEMLGRSWEAQVYVQEAEILGAIGTNTSYADVVQGEKQAKFHAERGWRTLDMALKATMKDIRKYFTEAVDEFTKKELET
jgi:hypothetical protein